jgi:hypothetical protein
MKRTLIIFASLGGMFALGSFLLPAQGNAAACASGVYRAGCAGPNGAVVVHKQPGYYHPPAYHHPPAYYHRPPVYHRPPAVACGSGPYRSGCVHRY